MSAVLVVEDEKHLADGLRYNLEAEGYTVRTVADGESALEVLLGAEEHYDAVVLDVMLPGKDGFAVASELRHAGQFVPVLMLTARARPEDVLRGFESGADDYLAKPFDLSILIARVKGLLRRREWFHLDRGGAASAQDAGVESTGAPSSAAANEGAGAGETESEVFSFGGKKIDFGALELRTGDETLRLTLMEAKLLRHLIKHAGRAVSRKSLLEEVWELQEDTDTRAIDNFIVRLRKYIEDEPSSPKHLLTVRGVGYRFVADVTDQAG
jgi:two-component system alkaline phosphatase synthesis response regulator PhoP